MPIDKTIPNPEPGIAGFSRESWQSPQDPRYGEGVPTTIHRVVTSAGAVVFPLYSVVNIAANGAITPAVISGGVSNANAILAAPATFGAGDSMSLPFYKEGHWNQDSMVWHASFNTDLLKQTAFANDPSSNIYISKKDFPNDAIAI
jgi:hypothetical protein